MLTRFYPPNGLNKTYDSKPTIIALTNPDSELDTLAQTSAHAATLAQMQPEQLPMLVTGIAGVSGYNAFHHFRRKFGDRVFGIRREQNWPLKGDGIIGCDIENYDKIRDLIERHSIRTILNCGGSCALKACELDPTMANRVNVEGISVILKAIASTEVQLVHLSVDLVFSGDGGGNYVETDEPDPVTVYGKTMVVAERLIMEQRPDSCILRISLPMGISFNGHAGAIDWIQSRFAKQKPATLYFDEVRTPTYVECLNEVIEEVFAKRITGLFHAGGPTQLSLYQIAQIVNRVGGYRPELLMGCPRIDAGAMPPRAGNVTMNSQKLRLALRREPFVAWPLLQNQLPSSRTWHMVKSPEGSPEKVQKTLYQRPISETNNGSTHVPKLA